jgi:hypothetical protein
VVNFILQPLYPWGKKPPTATKHKAEWAPEAAWMVLEYSKFFGMLGFEPQTVQPIASQYTYTVLVPVAIASTIIIQ